jgi:hypothetical protein
VQSLDPSITAAKFVSVCKDIIVELTGVSFVDDSSLCVTTEYEDGPALSTAENKVKEVQHLIQRLTALSQHWEKLLFTTGGAINFQKSHWYLMTWLWKQGIPTLATSHQLPASLSLTPGYSALPEIVPRLKPTQGFHTLGLYITPSENYATRAKVLRGYAERFNSQLKQSHLTPQEVYCCYMQYIRPKITYPFPCVSLTEKQCRHIQAPVLAAVLPRLPLNWHTPRAVLFAGPRYGGLGLSENYTDLGIGHLQYLVGHIKMGDEVGQLLLSSITYTQLQVGSVTPFFKLAYPRYVKWIDSTWIMDVWKFTNQAKVVIDVEKHWLPCLPHKHDAALMDLALTFNLNADQLKSINLCRLYLKLITVSDITNATGDRLLASAMAGFRDNQRTSTLLWHDIPQPPSSHWNTWRVFLQFFSRGSNLNQALGPWENRPVNSLLVPRLRSYLGER